MVALKRVVLVILVLLAPAALTLLLDMGAIALLQATNRVVDPFYVKAVSVLAFGCFTFIGFLEAKARW
jgi:O-antigen/teichoic acid export membrane protein